MPNPVMVLQSRQDSAKFSEDTEDNTIKGKMEGGYVHTRRRHTRPQLKKFYTGFTWLTEAERISLRDFYATVETWGIFDWTHPVTGILYTVRFEKPLNYTYVGMGGYHLHNVDGIALIQV